MYSGDEIYDDETTSGPIEPPALHERAMSLTEASVALRRRLTPHWSECPVNESGRHELYGGICHCGWSEGDTHAGSAVAPDRAELTVMLVAIEDAAAERGG